MMNLKKKWMLSLPRLIFAAFFLLMPAVSAVQAALLFDHDQDGDVDGADLLQYAVHGDPSQAADFAVEFGRSLSAGIRIEPSAAAWVGEELYFDASRVTGLGAPDTCTYAWDFGDSTMTARMGRAVVHSFMLPGIYTVTLSVTETSGSKRTESALVSVGGEYIKTAPRPATAPILTYAFENNLADGSSQHLPAQWQGGTGAFVPGREGRAARLSGNVSLVVNNAAAVPGAASGLTVSFWAKKDLAAAEGYLINCPGVFFLRLRSGSQWLEGQVRTHAGVQSADAWYMGAEDTNWHHYVLVYDGAFVRLYFDGREQIVAGKCPRALTGNLVPATGPMYIGSQSPTATVIAGAVDELRIYDRALSLSEIFTGFELWHADFHSRIAQYIHVQIPGEITREPANTLAIRLSSDSGYNAVLADKSALRSEEKVLLRSGELPAGNYTLTAELRSAAGAVLDRISERFAKPYDGIPRVGIDENNALRVNGELFFPVTPCGLRNFEIGAWAASAYINSLHSQGFWGMSGPPVYTAAGWEEYVTTGMNHGLMSFGPGGNWESAALGRNAKIEKLEEYVLALKDHPGTLAWIWRDEPELGGENEYLPAETVKAWTRRSRALDPQHPVSINLVGHWIGAEYPSWAFDRSGHYLFLNNARRFGRRTLVADMYSLDYYPVEWAAPHSRGATMAKLAEILDTARARSYNLVPFTSWVETCDINEADGAVRHPTPWHPTPDQLRMLIWLNVVHGMKGINWFPWHSGTPAANYPVMTAFVDQITRLTPVVLGPEIYPAVTVFAPGARIDTMVRRHAGKTYLFAVRVAESDLNGNSMGAPVTAAIHVQGLGSSQAVVFDEGRNITVTDGRLEDLFLSNTVHIYEIPE